MKVTMSFIAGCSFNIPVLPVFAQCSCYNDEDLVKVSLSHTDHDYQRVCVCAVGCIKGRRYCCQLLLLERFVVSNSCSWSGEKNQNASSVFFWYFTKILIASPDLLKAYSMWLPESKHSQIANNWPPCSV